METIDDDCSKRDISFVKTAEQEAVEAYGIAKLPALVFFKQDIPNLYEGMTMSLHKTLGTRKHRGTSSASVLTITAIGKIDMWRVYEMFIPSKKVT